MTEAEQTSPKASRLRLTPLWVPQDLGLAWGLSNFAILTIAAAILLQLAWTSFASLFALPIPYWMEIMGVGFLRILPLLWIAMTIPYLIVAAWNVKPPTYSSLPGHVTLFIGGALIAGIVLIGGYLSWVASLRQAVADERLFAQVEAICREPSSDDSYRGRIRADRKDVCIQIEWAILDYRTPDPWTSPYAGLPDHVRARQKSLLSGGERIDYYSPPSNNPP